jgi:cyclic pyranopterin phosphate synthase
MPEPDYAWLPRESILDFEEIAVLVDAFASLGVDRVVSPAVSRCCGETCRP